MSAWNHDQIDRKLRDGVLDWESFERWPEVARDHVIDCQECTMNHNIGTQLRFLAGTGGLNGFEMPEMPGIEALRQLAAQRQPTAISAGDMAEHQGIPTFFEAFRDSGFDAFRNGSVRGGLELHQTERGISVFHPLPCHVLVYAVLGSGPPVLLRQRAASDSGVSMVLEHLPKGTRRLVALGSARSMDPVLWGLWLTDVYRSDDPQRLAALTEMTRDRLHIAELDLEHSFQPEEVRVLHSPVRKKPWDETVIATLEAAGAAGREDRLLDALDLYQRALDEAARVRDFAGEIQAVLGMSIALHSLQFTNAAETVLQDLARRRTLDSRNAAWVCREQTMATLSNWELEAAERWLEAAERADPTATGRLGLLHLRLDLARGNHSAVLRQRGAAWIASLSEHARFIVSAVMVESLAQSGQISEALALMAQLREAHTTMASDNSRAINLLRLSMLLQQVSGQDVDWSAVVAQVRDAVVPYNDRLPNTKVSHTLLQLIGQAAMERELEAARQLIRLFFLSTTAAEDEDTSLMAVLSVPQGLVVLSGVPGAPVRCINMSRDELQRSLLITRQEAVSGQSVSPKTRRLVDVLFPDGRPPGRVLLGSNGLLEDTPMLYIASLLDDSRLPALQDLTGMRRSYRQLVGLPRDVASFADAIGDLPNASAEVSEAKYFYRRAAVTHEALRSLPPVGLLHIGVHASRERGIPSLILADGPIGPSQISRLQLLGSPIVLLSGCATAAYSVPRGVERSLASAFFAAGASAVIATRWPVIDNDMKLFVQRLMTHWPFTDPAEVTALVCQQLRMEGLPARIWAAPVVY